MVEKIPNECLRNCKGVCGFNAEPDSLTAAVEVRAPQVFMFITATLYKQQTTNKQSIK
jgi:hypothetical protein